MERTSRVSGGSLAPGSRVSVDVGNAGTVMRFLPAVASLSAASVAFDGDPRARERPVGALLTALRTLGVSIDDDGRGALPFTIHGSGAVRGGAVTLDASGSSQLVSGLLLAAARFDLGVEVRHSGPPVPSLPHIEMTVAMIRQAGADVEIGAGERPDFWRVRPGRLNLGDFTVEPDLSNAGPFLAAALVTGGSVTIRDWPSVSLQAADAILDVLTRMGGVVSSATRRPDRHRVGRHQRDRGRPARHPRAVPAADLGRRARVGPLDVHRGGAHPSAGDRPAGRDREGDQRPRRRRDRAARRPRHPAPAAAGRAGAAFESYDDHRMVMAAAVLGLAVPGIEVPNVATVGKTFPDFPAVWSELSGTPDTEPAP